MQGSLGIKERKFILAVCMFANTWQTLFKYSITNHKESLEFATIIVNSSKKLSYNYTQNVFMKFKILNEIYNNKPIYFAILNWCYYIILTNPRKGTVKDTLFIHKPNWCKYYYDVNIIFYIYINVVLFKETENV